MDVYFAMKSLLESVSNKFGAFCRHQGQLCRVESACKLHRTMPGLLFDYTLAYEQTGLDSELVLLT
jgi:hypothetical protein